MEFQKVLDARFSVREFSDKQVEDEKIQQILKTAQIAPTAKNSQPQKILVIKSDEAMAKFRQCTKCHFDAPLGFVICYDEKESFLGKDGRQFGVLDASIVTTYMMLKATELGLGTTWVGLFDAKLAQQLFGLPQNVVPLAFLPTGYPKEGCQPNPRHFDNKPLDQTTEWL